MHEPTAEEDEPGLVASALTLARLIAGWSGTGIGVLNLSMSGGDGAYLTFHIALLIAGAGLLAIGMLSRKPDRIALLAGSIAGGIGLVVTAFSGFPYAMGLADVVFCACLGFVVLGLVTVLRPAFRAAPGQPESRHTTHAEGRQPAPDDENVGGLP